MNRKNYAQALENGIVLYGKNKQTSIRTYPDGTIKIKNKEIKDKYLYSIIPKIPFIRGIVEVLNYISITIATVSSICFETEEDDNISITDFYVVFSIFLSFFLYLLLIIIIPSLTVYLVNYIIYYEKLNIVLETYFRMGMFLLVLHESGKSQKVKKTYQYHSAYHMVKKAYMQKENVSIEELMNIDFIDKKCQLTKIFNSMFYSLNLFIIIDMIDKYLLNGIIRIILFFVITGILNEVMNIKNIENSIIMSPGLLFQKILLKSPDVTDVILVKTAYKENILNNEI